MALAQDPYVDHPSIGAIIVLVLSLISFVLTVPTLVWHINNRNLPASALAFWVLLGVLSVFVNVLIWPTDDLTNWWLGVGYCDIHVKIDIAGPVGLVGSVACINKGLARVLDTESARLNVSKAQLRRQKFQEIFFCFVFPACAALLHYVVQPWRYYIVAITGCAPVFDEGWLTIVLIQIWPLIICVAGCYYAAMVLVRLHRYRREFADILTSSSSGLNKSRFIRLFISSLILLAIFLPVQMYIFVRNVMETEITTYSWSRTHDPTTWQQVQLIPTFGEVEFDRWIKISLGFIVFFCFGLGHEAKIAYCSWLRAMGFDVIFKRLDLSNGNESHDSGRALSRSSVRSFGSKARLIFSRTSHRSSTVAGSTLTSRASIRSHSHLPSVPEVSHTRRAPSYSNEPSETSTGATLLPLWSKRGNNSKASDPSTSSTAESNVTRWPRFPWISRLSNKRHSTPDSAHELQSWETAEDAMKKAKAQADYEKHVIGSLV